MARSSCRSARLSTRATSASSASAASSAADADANIIFGAVIKEDLADQLRITVVATGFDETRARIAQFSSAKSEPVSLQGVVSEPPRRMDMDEDDDDDREKGKKIYGSNDVSSDDDQFGDKFEIPAFLRKIQ